MLIEESNLKTLPEHLDLDLVTRVNALLLARVLLLLLAVLLGVNPCISVGCSHDTRGAAQVQQHLAKKTFFQHAAGV